MVMQLPRNCVPADLIEHFSKAGKVRDAKMIADRNSRKSKGIAYVEFVEPESVAAALAMNGERMGEWYSRLCHLCSPRHHHSNDIVNLTQLRIECDILESIGTCCCSYHYELVQTLRTSQSYQGVGVVCVPILHTTT